MATESSGWPRHAHRRELIGLVAEFVPRVIGIKGVRQVALIGSLCTSKADPKDADLLVTITEDLT